MRGKPPRNKSDFLVVVVSWVCQHVLQAGCKQQCSHASRTRERLAVGSFHGMVYVLLLCVWLISCRAFNDHLLENRADDAHHPLSAVTAACWYVHASFCLVFSFFCCCFFAIYVALVQDCRDRHGRNRTLLLVLLRIKVPLVASSPLATFALQVIVQTWILEAP